MGGSFGDCIVMQGKIGCGDGERGSRGALVIYLDTSALIKLYIRETGSEEVQQWVISQDDPLPVWELQEMELVNALYLKVFQQEISTRDAEGQIERFRNRRRQGYYFFPDADRLAWIERFFEVSRRTQEIGGRTLDIQHVAYALLLKPSHFVSFDARQRKVAEREGLNLLPANL